MKRYQLFEFEDLSWFPQNFRGMITDLLRFQLEFLAVYDPVIPILVDLVKDEKTMQFTDLCSGSGGQWLTLHQRLQKKLGAPFKVLLTDKFPNPALRAHIREVGGGVIDYCPEPVDVTDVSGELPGVRTMFSALHHFRPEQVKMILADAAAKKAPIAVFEFTERKMVNLFRAGIGVPATAMMLTPFIKPFSWARLFWTYPAPVFPLVVLWDALISHLRTYTPGELRLMVDQTPSPGFTWKIGTVWSRKLFGRVIYLIGQPA